MKSILLILLISLMITIPPAAGELVQGVIPDCDPRGISSEMLVTGCDAIEDVNVSLKINHSWVGDLVVSLKSPSGTEVILVDRPGYDSTGYGCGFSRLVAVLDDQAPLPVENQCTDDNGGTIPAILGTFSPHQPLAAFNGELGSGTWTLRISDWAEQNIGRVVDWNLDLNCRSLDVDLRPELAFDRERAMPGDTVILQLRLANIGTEPATGIEARYTLPDGFQVLWADHGAMLENGLVSQRYGSLEPGEVAAAGIGLLVTGTQWGWQGAGVDVRSEQTDRTADDNKATTRIFVGLGLQK